MKQAVSEAIETMKQHPNVIELLPVDIRGALNDKFLLLPQEIRSAYAVEHKGMTNAEMYILRQMTKEGNNFLASKKRPGWFGILDNNAAWLKSGDENLKKAAVTALKNLADSIDTKESQGLLKKYKVKHDLTSGDKHIIELAELFGVDHKTLK